MCAFIISLYREWLSARGGSSVWIGQGHCHMNAIPSAATYIFNSVPDAHSFGLGSGERRIHADGDHCQAAFGSQLNAVSVLC
jgi:hypothetical protein